MVILQKNKGLNSTLVLSGVTDNSGYEIEMLTRNEFESLPPARDSFTEGERSVIYKIDGLGSLSKIYGRQAPGDREVKGILKGISDCIRELRDHLLSADNLKLDLQHIFFDRIKSGYRFIYIPDRVGEFVKDMKKLLEDIMLIYDRDDRKGIVFLYDFYSEVLKDNFSPKMFCDAVRRMIEDSDDDVVIDADGFENAEREKNTCVRKLVPVVTGRYESLMVTNEDQYIGRSMKESDYCIDEPGISRKHASIRKYGNITKVTDCDSTNGTYVNNKRVKKGDTVRLKVGDTVSFAGVEYYCV